MHDENIYKSPESKLEVDRTEEDQKPKTSTLLKVLAVVFTLVSGFFNALQISTTNGGFASIFGGLAGVAIWGFILVGIFQLWKRFRNQRSRYKIYVWTTGILSITTPLSYFMFIANNAN